MKIRQNPYICPICYFKISLYGCPCAWLVDLVSTYYFHDAAFIFSEIESLDPCFKKPLEFLEKKGFLISSDIQQNSIQVMPNLSKCYVNQENQTLCWHLKGGICKDA